MSPFSSLPLLICTITASCLIFHKLIPVPFCKQQFFTNDGIIIIQTLLCEHADIQLRLVLSGYQENGCRAEHLRSWAAIENANVKLKLFAKLYVFAYI